MKRFYGVSGGLSSGREVRVTVGVHGLALLEKVRVVTHLAQLHQQVRQTLPLARLGHGCVTLVAIATLAGLVAIAIATATATVAAGVAAGNRGGRRMFDKVSLELREHISEEGRRVGKGEGGGEAGVRDGGEGRRVRVEKRDRAVAGSTSP